jgi:hypothetical protein
MPIHFRLINLSPSRLSAETRATTSTTRRCAPRPIRAPGAAGAACRCCWHRARCCSASISNLRSASCIRLPRSANRRTSPRAPGFIRLLVVPEQPRIEGEAMALRDEVMAQIFNKGDPKSKRTLTFNIEVTDKGSTRGLPVFRRRAFKNWRRIGRMICTNATAHTTAMSSSTSAIPPGATIETTPQPPPARTGVRCAAVPAFEL